MKVKLDADEIISLSENFFSSIPIQREKHLISTGSPIPTFDGYINTESNYRKSYSWSKLSTELSELQIELLRKYDLWYENSRFLIRKFLSDRLGALDESYKNGRKYIALNCPPDDTQSIKSFYKFKQHLNIQKNILSLIFSVVEDEKTNAKIIQEEPINPTCFISYSWDNDEHEDWVRELATKLQNNGVKIKLDQWNCHLGMDLTKYMETCVRESDFVLLICTPQFCQKANNGQGGVGYEKNIVTGEIFEGISSSKKLVPILRKGNPIDSLPSYLKSRKFIDFRNENKFELNIDELIRHLHNSPKHKPPPLGQNPYLSSDEQLAINQEFEKPIEESENRNIVIGEEAPHVILDMFFRRHGARIERFPLSLVNPDTLHGLEINGVLKNEGGGVVQHAVIIIYIHSKLISPHSLEKNSMLRPLKISFENEEEDVYRVDINWGGGSKMPLFKTVEYRLFEEDFRINFKHSWLEGRKSPFIMWEVRAPRMEPTKGFFRLILEDNFAVLKQEVIPSISEIIQDGKNRDFLKSADLSIDANL